MKSPSSGQLPLVDPIELPFLGTLAASFRCVFHNLGKLLRLSWAWFILIVVAIAALAFRIGNITELATPPATLPTLDIPTVALGAIAIAVVLMATASITVGWLRVVLLKETDVPPLGLRVDARVWTVLGYVFLIVMAIIIVTSVTALLLRPVFAPSLPQVPPGQSPTPAQIIALTAFGLLVTLPGWLLGVRFVLALPAAAIGAPLGLAGALRNSQGFTWRLLFGILLTSIPTTILKLLFQAIPGAGPGSAIQSIEELILVIVAIITGFAGLSFIAEAYRRLVDPNVGAEQATLPASA